MDVSIIIVNYNTKTLLKQCLVSVFNKTENIDFEIIVVDNASHDDSQQMLKNEFPKVKLIESEKNVGFGRANNLGAEQATGKYLFLLNSDTILINNAVFFLFDFLENNPKAGICCGNLFDENKKPNRSYFMYSSPLFRELNRFFARLPEKICYGKNATFNYTKKPKIISDSTAADLMIRAELFKKIKGFNTDFFMYGEDRYLNYIIKKQQYHVYNLPQAEIIHLEGKSSMAKVNRHLMIRQGTSLYYQKTQNDVVKLICRGIFFLTIYSRLNYFKFKENKEKYEFWRILLENEKKGYKFVKTF